MAKTARDGYRHAQMWIDFFYDVGTATEEMVKEVVVASKQARYVRQSLKRLEQRGFVVKKGNRFALSREGKKFSERYARREAVEKAHGKWDGKWRLVSFDVPVVQNRARHQLRVLLIEFGFYPLHKSVWASPYAVEGLFWHAVVDENLQPFCKAMVVEIIEGDEELRRNFKLPLA
ncbi:MAG: hypothetical protein V1885_00955 [Candidatus Brennerbacteria bacterium]